MADGSSPAKTHSENTRRSYQSSWRGFDAWCSEHAIPHDTITPEIVAEYLKACLDNGLSVRSVARIYTGIATALRKKQPVGPWAARARPPIIQQLIDDAWKTFTPPEPQTKRLLPEHIFALGDPRRFDMHRWFESARNRAILVFGFWAGFRRSELVSLDAQDLRFFADRVEVRTRSRKDPVVVWRIWNGPCPVAALEWYLRGARITSGPVFRSLDRQGLRLTNRRMCDKIVALIVKDAVASLGLDPNEYSGDSLWRGPGGN